MLTNKMVLAGCQMSSDSPEDPWPWLCPDMARAPPGEAVSKACPYCVPLFSPQASLGPCRRHLPLSAAHHHRGRHRISGKSREGYLRGPLGGSVPGHVVRRAPSTGVVPGVLGCQILPAWEKVPLAEV